MSVGEGRVWPQCHSVAAANGRWSRSFCHNSNVTCIQDQSETLFFLLSKSCCPRCGVRRHRGCCSAEKMGEQSQQTQANGHCRYCIIKVESAATVPVMRPCTAGCREMQARLQRGPALIDLYDPYPANRGLMGRDLWAKVPELGEVRISNVWSRSPSPGLLPTLSPLPPPARLAYKKYRGQRGSGPVD